MIALMQNILYNIFIFEYQYFILKVHQFLYEKPMLFSPDYVYTRVFCFFLQHVEFRRKMRVDAIISEWDPPEVNLLQSAVSAVQSDYTSVDVSRRRYAIWSPRCCLLSCFCICDSEHCLAKLIHSFIQGFLVILIMVYK